MSSKAIPGTGKRRRHNPEKREFRGFSHRKFYRVRELRERSVAKADRHTSCEIAAGGRVPKSGIRASRFEKLFTR